MSKLRFLGLGLCLTLLGCREGWSEGQVIDRISAPHPPYFGPNIAATNSYASLVYTSVTHLKASRLGLPWTAPETIGPQTSSYHTHAVTIGGDGVTTVLFTSEGTVSWSRTTGGAWTAPAVLESSGGRPSAAADAAGNVLGVWVSNGYVRAARYVVGSGWSTTATLAHATEVRSLSVVSNPAGVGVAVWCERRLDGAQIVASRFEPELGWLASTDLSSVPECAGRLDPGVPVRERTTVVAGISDAGVPTVMYADGDIKIRRQTLSPPTWALPQSLSSGGYAANPRLAVNGRNDAIAVWHTDTPGTARTLARRFTSSSASWGATSELESRAGGGLSPEVAVGIDDAGRGMVAYIAGSVAKARRYDGSVFRDAETLGALGDYELDLAMNRAGIAYLVRGFRQRDIILHTYNP